jgi:hypothetical protein
VHSGSEPLLLDKKMQRGEILRENGNLFTFSPATQQKLNEPGRLRLAHKIHQMTDDDRE